MANKIRCAVCRYAQEDENASERGWTAYECVNSRSEYHKSLLNVTINGEKQSQITWSGCAEGRAAL